MTEYDVQKMYAEQQEKDRVTALVGDNGVLTLYYADGTIEVWKQNWRGKFKRKGKRNDNKKY